MRNPSFNSSRRLLAGLFLLAFAGMARPVAAQEAQTVSFAKDLAPILVQKCLICHNPEKLKGGYRLDTFESLMKPGTSKEATITAGEPDKSHLLKLLLEKDPDDRMPQKDDPLPAKQVELFRRWIQEGAKFDGADAKLLLAELVHSDQPDPPAAYPRPVPITALAFSPDGKELAAAGYHEITIWNPEDGRLLRRIKNVAQQTHALAFSPDGKFVASASGTPAKIGEVKLFEAASGKLLKTLAVLPDLALCVCFSADGQRLASGGADNAIRVFNVATGKLELLIEQHADWVLGLAWSPDGTHLASASRDKSARIFNAQTGALEQSYLGHGEPVFSAVWGADGKQIFTGGRDKKIHAWEFSRDAEANAGANKKKGARRPGEIGGFEGDVLRLVAVSNSLLSCSTDKGVRLHSTESKELVRSFAGNRDFVYSLAFHDGTKRVASGGFDGEVRVWNFDDAKLVTNFTAAPGYVKLQTARP